MMAPVADKHNSCDTGLRPVSHATGSMPCDPETPPYLTHLGAGLQGPHYPVALVSCCLLCGIDKLCRIPSPWCLEACPTFSYLLQVWAQSDPAEEDKRRENAGVCILASPDLLDGF